MSLSNCQEIIDIDHSNIIKYKRCTKRRQTLSNNITGTYANVPVRIVDFGGWTDTWFAKRGNVANFAVIIRYFRSTGPFRGIEVIASSEPNIHNGQLQICAADPNYDVLIETADLTSINRVKSNLLLSTLHLIQKKKYYNFDSRDVIIRISSPVPPGASLGTSAAVSVALIKALCDSSLPSAKIVDLAWRAETQIMGGQSGIQDQCAAAYANGVNYISMTKYPKATCRAVKISPALRHRLEEGLITVFYGRHDSSATHRQVIDELEGQGPTAAKLVKIRTFAPLALQCLERDDLVGLGKVMSENTQAQAELAEGIVSSSARSLIKVAQHQKELLGWKVNGAGGAGGSITMLFGSRAAAEEFHRDCLDIYPTDSLIYFEHRLVS